MKKIITVFIVCLVTGFTFAENIDPYEADEKYAYAENVGWINFEPALGDGVQVSSSAITGKVWGENIGWIHFDETQSWNAQACVVTFEDLANFASYWLQSGGIPANLDMLNAVDIKDYAIFSSYWQNFCPDGWMLK